MKIHTEGPFRYAGTHLMMWSCDPNRKNFSNIWHFNFGVNSHSKDPHCTKYKSHIRIEIMYFERKLHMDSKSANLRSENYL